MGRGISGRPTANQKHWTTHHKKNNILKASIDTALLCCFPEKGKMVLFGKWYEITWYVSLLCGIRPPDIGWTLIRLRPVLNARALLTLVKTCFRTCSAFIGVECPSTPVIFRKKPCNKAYLHDMNQNTPENPSGGFLVFPTSSLGKRLTSSYGPPAHLRVVQDIQLTKVA